MSDKQEPTQDDGVIKTVEESSLSTFADPDIKRKRTWPKVLIIAGVAVVVLGGAYVGAAWYFQDKVPNNVEVAGVKIGGLSSSEAVAALNASLESKTGEPIEVAVGEKHATIDPAAAGLAFDADATVAELTGFSWSPSKLWHHVVGGTTAEPVTSRDEAKLNDALAAVTGDLETAPVEGAVEFVDSAPHATNAVDGVSVDVPASVATISQTWLTGARPIDLATKAVPPTIGQDQVDAAMTQAQAVAGGPVTVAVDGQTIDLPAAALIPHASFSEVDGKLTLQMDGAGLVTEVTSRTTALGTAAADAKFTFVNNAPSLVPGTPGTSLDPTALAAAVATAAASPTERTATVELVASEPSNSTAALEALGIKEKVSEFSTPLTSDKQRTHNLEVATSSVNGTLVRPGETFSISEALGRLTTANGYLPSGVMVDGKEGTEVGGGVSQMATTTYNAAYFAGMDLVQYKPHSFYFSRYPAGRESTVYYPSVDMKFKNPTDYGILIQSWIQDNRVYVAFWSTHVYDVTSDSSGQYNVVPATKVHDSSPNCKPEGSGGPGFTVTDTRKIFKDGVLLDTQVRTWTYKPWNGIVCDAPAGG